MCDMNEELKKYNELKRRVGALEKLREKDDDIERKKIIEKDIKKTKFEIDIIDTVLNMLPIIERTIIECRYIHKYTWVKTCLIVGYSETQSREKMKKGIEQLEVYKKSLINFLGKYNENSFDDVSLIGV